MHCHTPPCLDLQECEAVTPHVLLLTLLQLTMLCLSLVPVQIYGGAMLLR